jgi:putative copper resistance protein D
MSSINILMIGSYWLFLSGIVFIAGALISRKIITVPSRADDCIPAGKNKTIGEAAVPVIFTTSIIALISNITHVVLHCSVMTEIPLSEVFSVLPLFLLKTRYGMFSLIRTILMAMIVLVFLYALKKNDKFATITGSVLSLFLLVTLAMSGHQGTNGYLSLPFFLDVLHVIAITVWIGGLFFIRSSYSFFLKTADMESWDIFLSMINRFSLIATICVTAVISTGIILYLYSTDEVSQIITTTYGNVLFTKTVLALLLMMLGGINKFLLLPRLNSTDKGNWSKLISLRSKFNFMFTLEAFLGLFILLTTAILTHLSPGE